MRYEAVFPASIFDKSCAHLLQHVSAGILQEDLCFCLWHPSRGKERLTAIVSEVIEPVEDDRLLHRNVSFNSDYFSRALRLAVSRGMGLGFMHNHLTKGWQSMSEEDVFAERDRLAPASAVTGLPLVGFTMGTDGTLSARFWLNCSQRQPEWCYKVRVVGADGMDVFYNESKFPPYKRSSRLQRTIDSWGLKMQSQMARLKIGIVGVGSVGALITESLARMGIENLTLIDNDTVELHNLDRLINAGHLDIGKQKVHIAARYAKRAASAEHFRVTKIDKYLQKEEAYLAALDCDLLFCCVDRPLPKDLLNHIAYIHCIPVIFAGVYIGNKTDGRLSEAKWSVSVHAPGSRCLRCDGQYSSSDVIQELDGSLRNPEYLHQQGNISLGPHSQNVFPFSANLASFAVLEMIRLLIAEDWWRNKSSKTTYYFLRAKQERIDSVTCMKTCSINERMGVGDRFQYPFLEKKTEITRLRPKVFFMCRAFRKLTSWFKCQKFRSFI